MAGRTLGDVARRGFRAYVDGFRGLPRLVWILAVGALINRAGTMVLPFMTLYLRDALDFDAGAISVVLLAFGAGSTVGSLGGGRLCDRLGAPVVLVGALFSSAAGFLALILLTTPWAVALGFFVTAALGDAFRPAVMTAISEAAPEADRVRALSLLRLAINAGMGVGPAAGGWLATIDARLIFVGDALTCFAAAVTLLACGVLRLAPRRRAHDEERPPAGSPLRDGPFLLFSGLVMLFTIGFFQLMYTMPPYLKDAYGWPESSIGTLIALNAVIIMFVEMPLVRALGSRNPTRLFAIGAVLTLGSFAFLPLGPAAVFPILAILGMTIGEMLALPFSNAIVVTRASARHAMGSYMGFYTASFAIAQIIGPPLGFSTYARFGGLALWIGVAALGLLVALGTLILAPALRRSEPSAGGASS